MNTPHRVRRLIAVATLASSVAGVVGAAGAAYADSSTPTEPVPADAPADPSIQEAPPGSDATVDDSGSEAPTTMPPVEADPEMPPTPTEPETTTPPADEAPTTTAPSAIATVVASATVATAPQSPVATPWNGSVTLTWTPPAGDGGSTIDTYDVQRSSTGTSGWASIAAPTTTSYTAVGLTNGTMYYFRIAAHNSAGFGPYSTVVSAVPRTIPSAPMYPVATPNSTGAVMVTWQLPSNNGGATPDLYEVQRATTWIGPWTKVADVGVLGRLDDSALTLGTTYFYRVAAHNAAGWGAWSYLVAAVPRTAPAMVPWCNVYQQGSMRIQLKWQVPANNGAPIDYYWVELWKNGKFYIAYKKEAYQTDGGAQVYSTGLYDVRISAHNAAGDGPYCQQSTFVSY